MQRLGVPGPKFPGCSKASTLPMVMATTVDTLEVSPRRFSTESLLPEEVLYRKPPPKEVLYMYRKPPPRGGSTESLLPEEVLPKASSHRSFFTEFISVQPVPHPCRRWGRVRGVSGILVPRLRDDSAASVALHREDPCPHDSSTRASTRRCCSSSHFCRTASPCRACIHAHI